MNNTVELPNLQQIKRNSIVSFDMKSITEQ